MLCFFLFYLFFYIFVMVPSVSQKMTTRKIQKKSYERCKKITVCCSYTFSIFFSKVGWFFMCKIWNRKNVATTLWSLKTKKPWERRILFVFSKKAPLFVFSKSRVYGRGPFSSTFWFSEYRALCPLPDSGKFYWKIFQIPVCLEGVS